MKKVFLVLLCAFLVSAVYSKNIYDSADEETKALIEQADQLIEERKYETAFGLLSSDANEYIIAKRTEIATNYFAQSLMHQVFAFKDLEESETLYRIA